MFPLFFWENFGTRMLQMNSSSSELDKFLEVADQFKLGLLMTEMQHPLTKDLSHIAKRNLPGAIELCNEVDIGAFRKLAKFESILGALVDDVQDTFKDGGRVFLIGCGATGRLALCLESWWRRRFPGSNQVRGILAGGDLALIQSLEKAEDYPEFGKKHLHEANLRPGDLAIGITEGGETSYVIGAINYARDFCHKNPYILYCNEDPILQMVAQRSSNFIVDKKIKNISLPIGPMTLSGSTRMQASSVLQFIVGQALLGNKNFSKDIEALVNHLQSSERTAVLHSLITKESQTYSNCGYITYSCSPDLGMTILTDTTERSPTFGVIGLENILEKTSPALANLSILGSNTAIECYKLILGRDPHPLEWPDFKGRAGKKRLLGFDLSERNLSTRQKTLKNHLSVEFHRSSSCFEIKYDGEFLKYYSPFSSDSLLDLIDFKLFLNTHSTLCMGILGRYESNIMTWVRPNNYKLIDRTIRYASMLLEDRKESIPYDKMAQKLFEIKLEITESESVVERLVNELVVLKID